MISALVPISEVFCFSCLLVNSADRIIRVYEEVEILACGIDGEPEPIQKLQDLVNKCVIQISFVTSANTSSMIPQFMRRLELSSSPVQPCAILPLVLSVRN